MLFAICFICLYYTICLVAFFQGDTKYLAKNVWKELKFSQILIVLFLIILSCLLTVYLKNQDECIYYWDRANYWRKSIIRTNYMFSHGFIDQLFSLYHSINNDSYNDFLPSLIALPLKIIGFSYTKYILVNQVMFLIPSVIVQSFTVLKLNPDTQSNKGNLFFISIIFAFLFPVNYYALHQGFIDVAILLPISIALYLLIDFDFSIVSPSKDIIIGIMLDIIWLSRRYTLYFIIGYGIVLSIKALVLLLKEKN